MSVPILLNQISENCILNLLQGIQLFHKLIIPICWDLNVLEEAFNYADGI